MKYAFWVINMHPGADVQVDFHSTVAMSLYEDERGIRARNTDTSATTDSMRPPRY